VHPVASALPPRPLTEGGGESSQRVVPYLLSLLSDGSAAVRAGALKIATRTLAAIDVFAPSDSKIFPEYIFPALSLLSRDPEELVRTHGGCGVLTEKESAPFSRF
jgi:hypothetical protein